MSEPGAAPSAAPNVVATRTGSPRLRLALVGVVIAAAVGFLLVKGLGSSLDYFKTVDQAIATRHAIGTGEFRLEGTVVPGTVRRSATGATFDVGEGGTQIHVVNVGTPPQLFKAGMPVIVVGHFPSTTATTFESNQIMVKHSASYIAAHPDRVRASNGSEN
jgi:cytochrome c-type biogenesis protein CcmE